MLFRGKIRDFLHSPQAEYYLVLSLFKLGIGAVLLLMGWDALGLKGNSIFNIAAVTGLAFFPAAFARPILKRFSAIRETLFLSIGLMLCSLFIFLEPFVARFSLSTFFVVHFSLWVLIFLCEVLAERWFIRVCKNESKETVGKLSGYSMSVIQIAVLCGPIVVALSRKVSVLAPYVATAAIFAVGAIVTWVTSLRTNASVTQSISASNKDKVQDPETQTLINWYVFAFALVWPTVALFNMAAPLIAKNFLLGDIDIAAALEAVLAAAIALSGALYPKFTALLPVQLRNKVMIAVLVVAAMTLSLGSQKFLLVSLGLVLTGIAWGWFRVESRSYLARVFTPEQAGAIVANANALSAPLVIAYLMIYYIELSLINSRTASFVLPAAYLASGLVFLVLFNRTAKYQRMRLTDRVTRGDS